MTTKKPKPGGSALTEREQRIRQWRADAWALLSQIERLDVEPAAAVVRRLKPSPEVVACLPFFYAEWKKAAEQAVVSGELIIHSTVQRTNALDAVIDKAIQIATDPSDNSAVWAALEAMADEKPRPTPPLLELVDGEIKYRDACKTRFLKKKNLGERLRRRAKAR